MTLPVDANTAAAWLFDERFEAVAPSDAAGNLDDLEVDSSLTRPTVDTTYSNGVQRVFTETPPTGFEVADTNDDLLLARNLTIVAIVALDTAAQDAAGTPGTVVWRGRDTDESSFGLRLTVEDIATNRVRIQLIWELEGGTEVVDSGIAVTWPPDEEYLIAAIREVESGGFTVRYVVNAQAADGGTGHTLGLGGTSGASVFIGTEPTGAASYTNHLIGKMAYLEIFNNARSVEEIVQLWLNFYIDAPRGITAVRGLLPPGAYSEDPASFIQREVAIEGAALGFMRNRGRRRREFPDAASGDKLAEWERLTARTVPADNSIDQRQARLVDYLQLDPGHSTDDLLAEMLDLLGYTDPLDIDLLLYSSSYTQDFSTWTDPGEERSSFDNGSGAWTIASEALEVDATGPVDSQFRTDGNNGAPWHLFSLTDSRDAFFGSQVERQSGSSTGDVLYGWMMGSRQTNDWLWVGLVSDGADYKVHSLRFVDGALESTFTQLDSTAFNATVIFFRFRHVGDGVYNGQWGTSDALAQALTPVVIAGPTDPLWVGPSIVAIDASSAAYASWDDVYLHEANGTQPITYRVFRDPGDPGAYDIGVAQDFLAVHGHGHYDGFVTDLVQLKCNTTGGCNREPMGI